ncbi:DUF3967 domain-containing protein (plasmid) [Bacillus mycoides]|nr:DUF3967 domain-containing protein [Bacillus mycoides]
MNTFTTIRELQETKKQIATAQQKQCWQF